MEAAVALVFPKSSHWHRGRWASWTPSPVELGFAPRHRLDWSDRAGAVHLACWHRAQAADAGAWHQDDGALAVVAGDLRWRGRDWEALPRWAPRLHAAAGSMGLEELADRLRGLFIAGWVNQLGDGWLITDPLGLRLLYWGEDEEVVAVSSRAALVAAVLARFQGRADRDPGTAAWLAYTGFRVGDGTGFRSVRVAPPGARLLIRSGTPSWDRTDRLVLAADDDLRHSSVEELAEVVHDDVADSLRATLSCPAERHVIRLTGGKDSRLVLAAAVRAGLEREFVYETVGPPDLPDVEIAAELCAELGLQHRVRFLEGAKEEPFADRFRRFVEWTACQANGWDLGTRHHSGEVCVTGLCGEALRRFRTVPVRHQHPDRIAAELPRTGFGQLRLLPGAAADELHRQLLEALATQPTPQSHPLDRMHRLYAGSRLRYTRAGAREELSDSSYVVPLYSRTTLRAAMSLDPRDRQSEVLFAVMMAMASSRLAAHRFAGPGWDDRASAHLDLPRADASVRPPGGPAPAARRPPGGTLVESIYAAAPAGRTELLREVVQDRANPAWDQLDRDAAEAALDRYASLTTRQRHELFGAATAAVWLGDRG